MNFSVCIASLVRAIQEMHTIIQQMAICQCDLHCRDVKSKLRHSLILLVLCIYLIHFSCYFAPRTGNLQTRTETEKAVVFHFEVPKTIVRYTIRLRNVIFPNRRSKITVIWTRALNFPRDSTGGREKMKKYKKKKKSGGVRYSFPSGTKDVGGVRRKGYNK